VTNPAKTPIDKDSKFLKEGTSPEDIKIYELYLERWGKEASLILSRFQIFLGVTSVIFVAMAFLITLSFNSQTQTFGFIPFDIWKLVWCLCILGFVSSVFWVLASINGNHRQNVINKTIWDVENDIFISPEQKGIGHRIEANNNGLDVTHINIYISCLYVVIFVILSIVSSRYS
jgi:hypothetical protein